MRNLRLTRAFILVSTLWTLLFLAILAVTLLAGVRQRLTVFGRVEQRGRAQLAAEAGVKKAIAVLLDDMDATAQALTPRSKERRMNNPGEFARIPLGGLVVEVVHRLPEFARSAPAEAWGLGDEASKLNVNIAPREVIRRLVMDVLQWDEARARTLADALADWRDHGAHQVKGFFSDDYYKSLEFPYPMKDRPFERPDELLLVKGVDKAIVQALEPYLTVYGDGRVNINTASKEVLAALGLEPAVADKIIQARRGPDNAEATLDDHVFVAAHDIAAEASALVRLEPREARQIDELNARGLLTTGSFLYSFISRVPADSGGYMRTISCVFSALDSKILYWSEK
jgi:type II secretory pathway component PulK